MPPQVPTPGTPPSQSPQPRVVRGTCYAMFAYDVGLAINLEQAEQRIAAGTQRGSLRAQRRTPHYFDYQPAPVRLTLNSAPIQVGAQATDTAVDILLFDFGAVSVQYSIPLHGPFADLLAVSTELYAHSALLAESRRLVESLAQQLGPTVAHPAIADLVEDYQVYQLEELAPAAELHDTLREHAALLAQVLRAERTPLAAQEIDDTLACAISYAPDDRTLIDWNAALLFGRNLDDVRAVLEFANIELLELRYLDDRLDDVLDQAYQIAAKGRQRWLPFVRTNPADLWRIARLQTDHAVLYEGVNNALKLLGDQFLARVHRLATQRFHLTEWDQSIQRKLQTIESIYEKVSDRNANRRMELLEWIIILLIALGIVMPLLPHAGQ